MAEEHGRARLPVRVLLVSPEVPPLHTGHAAVIERVFRGIEPDDYQLLAFSTREVEPGKQGRSLPAKTHVVRGGWPFGVHAEYRLGGARLLRTFLSETHRRARVIAEVVRHERIGAIVVTSSNTPDPAAALAAARLTGVPLIVYMLDNWRHLIALSGRACAMAANALQPRVLAGARLVMAPNMSLAADLWRDHGRRARVVGIPLPDPELLAEHPQLQWPLNDDEVRIVFTGQVYEAHFDAVRRLLWALDSPSLPRVTLHLYTSQSEERIAQIGLRGHLRIHPHVPPPGVNRVQREADILFLPLGFSSPYPDIIRTASPTKTGEYLASGRPMLVHAPPDSYPAAAARRFGFAALVDAASTEALADAILRIINDADFRNGIVANARRAAHDLYGPQATDELFVRSLQSALGLRLARA